MLGRALIFLACIVFAQDCPDGLQPPALCGTPNAVAERTECTSDTINFPDFPPCCRLHKEQEDKCDDPDATSSCRSMEVDPAVCPDQENLDCCFRKEITMKLFLEFEVSNKTCCSNCRCYGDPHCEAFDGTPDTWVICDARNPKPGNKARCPMDKTTCNEQIDHAGQPCRWIQEPHERNDWLISLQGSPCRHTLTEVPPQMTMYKGEDFSIVLNMGERSIIEDLVITEGAEQYVLNATRCFESAQGDQVNPWRDAYGAAGMLPEAADWLPKKWTWSPLDGQDIVWEVVGLPSQIDITVRCTRTPERVGGKIKYGPARLNVDIVEPFDWKDVDTRPNVGGFCSDGFITKQGSTANTDAIDAINACSAGDDNLKTAKALCGEGVTAAGVSNCMLRWCKDHLPIVAGPELRQACINDIQTYGWPAEFCALNVFGARTCNGDPACLRTAKDCKSDKKCRECMNLIEDDGWGAAQARYENVLVDPSEGDCVTRAQLPADLLGFCQKGVRVQYKDPFTSEWRTRFAIPSTTCLENGYVEITKQSDPELIYNPMRILQCGEPEGTCLTNKCSEEIGFTAHIEVKVEDNPIEDVWNAFENGDLVCDPQRFTTPTECLEDGYTPEKMCPCDE